MNTITQHLMRSRRDKFIGGVAGGISHYLAIDPLITRLVLVLLIFSGGIAIPIYLLLWVIMPLESEQHANKPAESGEPPSPTQRNRVLGTVLVIVGAFVFISYAMPWIYPYVIPALLISAGVLLIRRSRQQT